MIRTAYYVDVSDFPGEIEEFYGELIGRLGIGNGEFYSWIIDESDSVPASYIGKEKCDLIDEELRKLGLKTGDSINLVSYW